MASPEAWLRNRIEDAAGCAAYPVAVPEGVAPPFVRYVRAETTREPRLSEPPQPIGTFGVEIYADGYLAGKQLADLIREAVNNFSGSEDGTTIQYVNLADERDGEAVYLDGRDLPTYVVEQNYVVSWQE